MSDTRNDVYKPSKIERACELCGKPFWAYPSQIKLGQGRFCSRSCGSKNKARPAAERFWERVEKGAGEDDCWLWTGCRTRGSAKCAQEYGVIGIGGDTNTTGKLIGAHRLSWELHHGPIPENLGVLHKCDTPLCVRPDHLFLGTQVDNNDDKVQKKRHRFGSRSHLARIDEAKAKEIRDKYATGQYTQAELAEEYCLSKTGVWYVIHRVSWDHV